MKYRLLGRTGLKVSEIALGCEGFNGRDEAFCQSLFDLALASGVNCMDLYTPNPQVHRAVARAIRGRREGFVLQAHLCTVWKDGQYQCTRRPAEVSQAFEALLHNLETDYLDIGMIHYVDSPETWKQILNGPVMAYAREQKRAGRIRHLGLSSHNPQVALAATSSVRNTPLRGRP